MSSIWLMLKPETPGGGSLDPGGVFARPGSRTGLGAIGPMTHSGLEKMAQAQHYARPRHGAGGIPLPPPAGPVLMHKNVPHRGRMANSTTRRDSSRPNCHNALWP
jgi:hypothetical protein